MILGGSFRLVISGLTLKRCSQLAVFATQPVGEDAVAVWLIENGDTVCGPLPSFDLVHFRRWRHARGREHCREEPGNSALSGGYDGEGKGQLDRRRVRVVLNPCA